MHMTPALTARGSPGAPRRASQVGSTVYSRLRRGILRGEYDGRARISEIGLARALRVSRTPVREALLRLEQEGLITRDGPRKLVVSSITPEEIGQIYPMVAALEGLAARLAAPRVTAADLRELRALDARMGAAAGRGNAPAFFDFNHAFHRVFIRRAENPYLEAEIGKFRLRIRRFRVFLMNIPGRMGTSADEHTAIVEALAARDPDRAEAAVRAHVASAERTLRQTLEAVRMLS